MPSWVQFWAASSWWDVSKLCLPPALSLLAVWLHAQCAGPLSPEVCCDLVPSLPLDLYLAAPDCTPWIGLYELDFRSQFFFIFPSLEMLLDPVSSSWLWSEPVGHGLCWGHWLMANFPLGNGFTSLVYASRLKVYTKLILKRCSYNLFGQILILFDLLHFYSPNNFPFNIIDISPFTIGTYWQITSRLTVQYKILRLISLKKTVLLHEVYFSISPCEQCFKDSKNENKLSLKIKKSFSITPHRWQEGAFLSAELK